MSYENEKNRASETETLSSDEESVSRLLSNLKRVDAPKDFDFHLKARLANASPDDYRPVRLFPILKYAMPLALLLFVGAAFVLTNSYTGPNVPVVVDVPDAPASSYIADSNSRQQAETGVVPTLVPESTTVAENQPPVKREFVAAQTNQLTSPGSNRPASRDLPGSRDLPSRGSYDITGRSGPDPIRLPASGNVNSNLMGNSGTSGPLETRQMLRNIGIDANAGENGWTIRSVGKNTIAERSGLQAGDVMEAIDDKPISTLYDGSFSAKTISVRRDDKVVKIEIQNK